MTVDRKQDFVGGHRAETVEQQAHAPAAVGRAEQTFDQNLAHQVLAPNEILYVEASLCRISQGQSGSDGIVSVREGVKARLPRMRRNAWPHHRRQRGALVAYDRRGGGPFAARRKATTGGERKY